MNDADFTYDTQTEADQGEALAKGAMYPERCWISTDRDVWHRNPFYTGPDKPHPELDEVEPPDPAYVAQLWEERQTRMAELARESGESDPNDPAYCPF